jgi:hypothetical protein
MNGFFLNRSLESSIQFCTEWQYSLLIEASGLVKTRDDDDDDMPVGYKYSKNCILFCANRTPLFCHIHSKGQKYHTKLIGPCNK